MQVLPQEPGQLAVRVQPQVLQMWVEIEVCMCAQVCLEQRTCEAGSFGVLVQDPGQPSDLQVMKVGPPSDLQPSELRESDCCFASELVCQVRGAAEQELVQLQDRRAAMQATAALQHSLK